MNTNSTQSTQVVEEIELKSVEIEIVVDNTWPDEISVDPAHRETVRYLKVYTQDGVDSLIAQSTE